MLAMSAVSSPQTKAPAPSLRCSVELPAAAEHVLAEVAARLGVGDRLGEALDGQRVLGAHVHVALVRADRVAADEHAFDDGVRVALEDGAVHERPGVALVGVADDVLLVALALIGELPLDARGEAGAAAAADARVGDLLDDPLGRLLAESHARGLVAAARQILLDALGIDDAHVAQGDARLLLVEADLVPVADARAGLGVLVEELLDRRAALEVLCDDRADVLGAQVAVQRVVAEHDHRAHGAQAVAADDRDFDALAEAGLPDLLDEGVVDGQRAREHAGRAGADRDPVAPAGSLGDAHVTGVLFGLSRRDVVSHGVSAHPFSAPTSSMKSRMILRVLSGVRPP